MKLKEAVFATAASRAAWSRLRRHQQRRDYLHHREFYANEADRSGLTYSEDLTASAVQRRFRERGYSPKVREFGNVHTFAFIPRDGWHFVLYNDLGALGPVTEFDFKKYGFSQSELHPRAASAAERRDEMNNRAFKALVTAHDVMPVDWAFIYGNGRQVSVDFLKRIAEELGIPTVSMCLDDKQSWAGSVIGQQREGQIDLAEHFDLAWTSARVACEWYLAEGGRPLYLPEGFDQDLYRPLGLTKDIPVSFVGDAYGFRPAFVRLLEKARVPVQVFGNGWGTRPVYGQEQVEIINRSVINLGSGGVGYDANLTNVKTRDFEIPGTGGGMYLTSFNADLAQHYDVSEEIACYGSDLELVELIRHYLKHPDEAEAMASRARDRCVAEHRWLHRYVRILQTLGILRPLGEAR